MIDLRVMYTLYVNHLDLQVKKVVQDREPLIQALSTLTELIKKQEHLLVDYCKTDVDTILKASSKTILSSIKFPVLDVYENGRKLNFNILKVYIERYVDCNRALHASIRKEEITKVKHINFTLYKMIIMKFTKKMVDKVIEGGYNHKLVPSFGGFSVYGVESKRKRINWGQSNKNRAAIIARGDIPYVKEDAINLDDYKGIKWMVYRPPLDYFVRWDKPDEGFVKYNPIIKDYTYKAARGKKSIATQLSIFKQDSDRAKLLYKHIKRKDERV